MTDVVLVGDFGKDLDDEFALLLAAALVRAGLIRLLGVVANLAPALERARLAKGTLRRVGLGDVPVAVGRSVTEIGRAQSHETAVPYLASADALAGDGLDLMRELLETATGPVTLVLNSALTDTAELAWSDEELFRRAVGHVVIMGGVTVGADGRFSPDDAANNAFDPGAAAFLYKWLQDNGIPCTVLMREAAYACQMAAWLPVMLAELGHPVALELARRLPLAMEELWQAVHAPVGSMVRGSLPPSRTRDWFVRTTTGKEDPGIGPDQSVWRFVETFRLYDPMNLLAAVPELAERFYDPETFAVNGIVHRVIGRRRDDHRVRDPNDLRGALAHLVREALTCST